MSRRGAISYKYIQCDVDRNGNKRCYFRRGKGEKIRLPLPDKRGFLKAYEAALKGISLAPVEAKRIEKAVNYPPDTSVHTPRMGVYLLLLDGKVVYVGTSLNMEDRVAEHKRNGRPFDKALYIGTGLMERYQIEKILISQLQPVQNRNGLKWEPDLTRRPGRPRRGSLTEAFSQ